MTESQTLGPDRKLSIVLDGFQEKSKALTSAIVRRTALDIYSRIARRTPVDTGRARGNWALGVGQIPVSNFEPKVTPRKDKDRLSTPPPLPTGFTFQALARLAAYDAKVGQTIYIANSVPYIRYLEYGPCSKQAPQGMVRRTLAEFQGIVKESVLKERAKS